MVKHQRRSHQRGMHPNELLDDCTSDSESGESPSTPKHAAMHWPTQGVMPVNQAGLPHGHMHRAASFGDFGQQMGYPVPHQQHPQYAHRHSMSSNAHEYHAQPMPEQPPPPHAQHPGVRMMHRTSSMPHPYYVTEHNNPGVATMNTQQIHPQYQVPRQQQVDGVQLEIPYQQGQGVSTSIQNSPTSFSVASGRSPTVPENGFYTLRPAQSAGYVDHQQQQPQQGHMQQYQQQPHQQPAGPHPQPVPSQASQAPTVAQTPAPAQQQPSHESQQPQQVNSYPSPSPQPPQAVPSEEYWNGVPYQAPVEVATIGSLPTFGSGVYDMWGPKIEFEDPSMQLPSARIENM